MGQCIEAASFYIRESFSRRLLVEDDAPKALILEFCIGLEKGLGTVSSCLHLSGVSSIQHRTDMLT